MYVTSNETRTSASRRRARSVRSSVFGRATASNMNTSPASRPSSSAPPVWQQLLEVEQQRGKDRQLSPPSLDSTRSADSHPAATRSRKADPLQNAAQVKASKLSRIGMLLRKRGEPDALKHLLCALHLDPAASNYWYMLGGWSSQDSRPTQACAAFRAATTLASAGGGDATARAALATVLAHLGQVGEAADELLQIHRLLQEQPGKNISFMAEPLERLCRRLMPGHRFSAVQSTARATAWQQAIVGACQHGHVMDISSTPLPALLAATFARQSVVRVESLPLSVISDMLKANGLKRAAEACAFPVLPSDASCCPPTIKLIAAASNGTPPQSLDAYTALPGVILADSDAADILSSRFLSNLAAARLLTVARPKLVPCAIEVHAALVESEDLARLNSVTEPVSGLDLSALNELSHRMRAVRLAGLEHIMLTKAVTAVRLQLDGEEPPASEGEAEVEMHVERSGKAHAIIVWHTLELGEACSICTGPGGAFASDPSVRQAAHYLRPATADDIEWSAERTDVASDAARRSHNAPDGIGAVSVVKGQVLKLGMRWRPERTEFQLIAPPCEQVEATLIARSGPRPTRVRDQNFGASSVELPLSTYHFPMLNDRQRNDAFAAAISRTVSKIQPALVLDIGSGTGLLAMLAAKAGAPRVMAIEMTPELAAIARQLIEAHGFAEAIRVMACHSSSIHLSPSPAVPCKTDPWEQRADLLVFEILGTDPLCEGLLPALRDARSRLLRPGASILPCVIEVHAALVESEDLARLNSVTEPVSGLDLSALNELSHRTRAVRLADIEHVMLTKAVTAVRLQLDGEEPPASEGEAEVEMHVERSGKAHAICAWFTAHLDAEGSFTICTAPGVAEPMRGYSWGQSAHFLPAPLPMLCVNETVRLRTRWTDKGLSFAAVRSDKKATSRTADMDHAVVTGNLTRDLMQVKQHAEEMRRRDEQLARKG